MHTVFYWLPKELWKKKVITHFRPSSTPEFTWIRQFLHLAEQHFQMVVNLTGPEVMTRQAITFLRWWTNQYPFVPDIQLGPYRPCNAQQEEISAASVSCSSKYYHNSFHVTELWINPPHPSSTGNNISTPFPCRPTPALHTLNPFSDRRHLSLFLFMSPSGL